MKYIILATLAVLAFAACENNPSKKIISVSKEQVLELIDTIAIDIDADQMGDYLKWSISEDNFFVAYHHWRHKIDVFNLSDRKFSYSIKLDNQGPNGVFPLGDIKKIQDEYFARAGMHYYRLTPKGLVLDKKMFSDLNISKEGYLYSQNGPHIANFDYFSLDMEQSGFFQPIYKYQEDQAIDLSVYFMCFIDYTTWESKFVPVKYPTSFIESHANSITLGDANIIRFGSSIIFNFPSSNDVYVFDTLNRKVKNYCPDILNKKEMKIDISEYGVVGNSANSIEDAISWSNAQKFSPRYFPIKYDKINSLYYRLHKTKVEGSLEKGASMYDANFFLIKMDRNFNTLAQYDLGSMFYPSLEIVDGYLYFTPIEVDKTALHFLKIYRMKP